MDSFKLLSKPIEIWVPVIKAKLIFSLSESVQLPKLHYFFLASIYNYNADIDLLVDVTNLSEQVVRQEFHEMYKQKLLILNDSGSYVLSDLACRLLRYVDNIKKMNEQDITLLFNLVTRDIKILDEEPDDKPYGAVAEKVAFANEIDCMELSEIKDILLNSYPFLGGDEEEIDDFFENLVIRSQKTNKWKKMYITALPLLPSKAQPEEFNVRCFVKQKEFRSYDSFFEENEDIIFKMEEIADFNPALLSDEGKSLLDRSKLYRQKREEPIVMYYNPVAGYVEQGKFKSEFFPKNQKHAFDIQQFSEFDSDDEVFEKELEKLDTNDFDIVSKSELIIPFTAALSVACITETWENDEK